MSAEWAGVVIGAVGVLVSIAIAVVPPFRQWLKRRMRIRPAQLNAAQSNLKPISQARLQIVTSRWAPNGIRLEFHYMPEFLHRAVTIQVTIITRGVRLIPGRPVLNPAPMVTGGYVRWEFNGYCIEGSGPVKLIPADGPAKLIGVMFLMPDGTEDWILREGRIDVSINDGGQVATGTYSVSPIGEDPNTVFAEPPALQPVRLA